MGPWSRAFLARYHVPAEDGDAAVSDLRVEPSLITACVDGRPVTLSAPPIAPGVWAAVRTSITPDRQTEQLLQLLEHTWEEPLVPKELGRIGRDEDVAAVVRAVAKRIDRDPATLLRWRGYTEAATHDGGDAWRGGEFPPLPPPARRPPESVPKRFGATGITVGGEDVVETLIRAYAAFG